MLLPSTLCCIVVLLGPLLAWAGPLEELGKTAGLGSVDAARLKNGEVISARGAQGGFARGVYIESCYFVKAPPEAVETALLHWDPSKHPEDEVSIYETFRAGENVDFTLLASLTPKRPANRWLLEQSRAVSEGKANELHLSPADAAIFRREADASPAWKRVLERRASVGLAAAARYLAGDLEIEPPLEYRSLIGMTPKIAARFAGAESSNVTGYAEQGLTQGHTSFCLGTLSSRKTEQSWQIVDCTYYTSDTYLLSANLYEIWSWEGGALVWQVDYVSAAFRAYARGLDKMFAGREMMKETAKSIEMFRRSVAR